MSKTVKRIRPKDYELSVVQDNLADAIQELIDAQGSKATSDQITLKPLLQQLRGAGSPQTIQTPALLVHGDPSNSGGNTIVLGDPASANSPAVPANVLLTGNTQANGTVGINGYTKINGSVSVSTAGVNGFVIMPPVAGPAFYVTNIAGNSATFVISDDGTFAANGNGSVNGTLTVNNTTTAPSFVSGQGFKSYIRMGNTYRSNGQTGNLRSIEMVMQTSVLGATGYVLVNEQMPFAGSIVGLAVWLDRPVNSAMTLQVYRNAPAATTGAYINVNAVATGAITPATPITFPKGQFPFNAGDYLGMGTFLATGAVVVAKIGLVVEFGA